MSNSLIYWSDPVYLIPKRLLSVLGLGHSLANGMA